MQGSTEGKLLAPSATLWEHLPKHGDVSAVDYAQPPLYPIMASVWQCGTGCSDRCCKQNSSVLEAGPQELLNACNAPQVHHHSYYVA